MAGFFRRRPLPETIPPPTAELYLLSPERLYLLLGMSRTVYRTSLSLPASMNSSVHE